MNKCEVIQWGSWKIISFREFTLLKRFHCISISLHFIYGILILELQTIEYHSICYYSLDKVLELCCDLKFILDPNFTSTYVNYIIEPLKKLLFYKGHVCSHHYGSQLLNLLPFTFLDLFCNLSFHIHWITLLMTTNTNDSMYALYGNCCSDLIIIQSNIIV